MIRSAGFFIRFLWELPQNLLGLAVWGVVRKRVLSRKTEGGRIFLRVPDFGLSLGNFIFWSMADPSARLDSEARPDNRMHEFGHSIQSARLGPLYLIVVGIPSVSRFLYAHLYRRRRGKSWARYFNGYPENWADRLAEKSGGNGDGSGYPDEKRANA